MFLNNSSTVGSYDPFETNEGVTITITILNNSPLAKTVDENKCP